jgi:phosphate acetyltransferase
MAFIDTIIEQARREPRHILLPEPEDERTLRAAAVIEEQGIAKVTLLGDEDVVQATLREVGIERTFTIVDPARSAHLDDFAATFYEMRKAKGLTEEAAREQMKQPIPHGIMMLHKGLGDGLVAGAIHSTADTLRPALQILKTSPGASLVSSFFFMTMTTGETYLFADCGLVENPNADQLAEIALETAQSAVAFDIEPTVAMLSYSTKGSAKSELVDKVVEATRIAQKKAESRFGPDSPVRIDGELQGDSAVVDRVGRRKAPQSDVAGRAKVLIFPDLNAGNIAYKLVQYLGGAEAYGPIIQGVRLPVNDLSRGCSADDIVGVAAVTVVQSQMLTRQQAAVSIR